MDNSSSLPKSIGENESIARFLRQSSYVNKNTGRVKYNAFLPAPDNDTSTFRVDSLSPNEIEALAKQHIAERSKNGSAIFKAVVLQETNLTIQSLEPPPRHANISNWAMDSDPVIKKSKRNTAALILAEESTWLPASDG